MKREPERIEKKMKCEECCLEMKKSSSIYVIERQGYRLLLNNVPVYVCPQCGAKYFDEDEVEAIRLMVEHLELDVSRIALAG